MLTSQTNMSLLRSENTLLIKAINMLLLRSKVQSTKSKVSLQAVRFVTAQRKILA